MAKKGVTRPEAIRREKLMDLAKRFEPRVALDDDEIRAGAIDSFTRALDRFLSGANLQEGETLMVFAEFDIVDANGRWRSKDKRNRESPEYIEWRTTVMARDGYKCAKCGLPAAHAHHIQSWSEAPTLRYDVNNGAALCIECHVLEHPELETLIRSASR